MRKAAILLIFTLLTSSWLLCQDPAPKKMVSIPEDQLTEQQKTDLKLQQADQTLEKAHGWVGIGKELGQAFDQALSSLTTRSNEFAQTPVGKFTMFIVAWKVMGDQAAQFLNALVHFAGAIVEMVVFLPLIIWSYRRNCLPRRVLVGFEGPFWNKKKTWQVIDPKVQGDRNSMEGVDTAKWTHLVMLAVFIIIWLVTVFSY